MYRFTLCRSCFDSIISFSNPNCLNALGEGTRTVRQYRGMHVSGVVREEPAHVLDQSPHCVVQVKKLNTASVTGYLNNIVAEVHPWYCGVAIQASDVLTSCSSLVTIPAFPDLLCLSAFSIPHIRYVDRSHLLGLAGERSQLCVTGKITKKWQFVAARKMMQLCLF